MKTRRAGARKGATWTAEQREAVRAFLAIVQPNNASMLVTNIEDVMPTTWRVGFEAMFAKLDEVSQFRSAVRLLARATHGGNLTETELSLASTLYKLAGVEP